VTKGRLFWTLQLAGWGAFGAAMLAWGLSFWAVDDVLANKGVLVATGFVLTLGLRLVYRAARAARAWLVAAARSAGLELAGVAAAASVVALAWAAIGFLIGRMYERDHEGVGWTDLTPRGAAPDCGGRSRTLV
jgi:hypothetical protein